jgi:hypothetical protein
MGLSVSGAIKAHLKNRSRRHFKIKLKLTKRKSFHPLSVLKRSFSLNSSNSIGKRKIFRINPFKMGMQGNSVLAIVLILVMLISVFAWLSVGSSNKPTIVQPVVNDPTANPSTTNQTTNPTSTINPVKPQNIGSWLPNIISSITNPVIGKPPGLIESNQNLTATVWKTVAANAWQYYQPDNGVDRNTGLPKASLGFPDFTDWDLGVYIQAIIDANQTGLIGYDGDWGSNARINKVLTFLETRELNNASYPYWFYQASDGKDYHAFSDAATSIVDTVDTGRLFVALNNLRNFNSNFTQRVNSIVVGPGNRSDYSALVPGIVQNETGVASLYGYYYISGFAAFFSQLAGAPNQILNKMLTTGNVTTPEGIQLPRASISCEPLLCAIFELNNSPQFLALAKQVYLAHEARYNATGQYVAFSEGNTMTGFIYEWVVSPTGDTWKIIDNGATTYSTINPIIFTKVSMSFLALYNTTFARNMAIYLEQNLPDSTSGYYAGADYNTPGNVNLVLSIDSNSNGMILDAARYAINNFQ